MSKEKKESKDKILKRLVQEKHPEAKWVEQIEFVGNSSPGTIGAITEEGVFTYSLIGSEELSYEGELLWDSIETGEVDHLALSSIFTLGTHKIKIVGNGKQIQQFLQNQKNINLTILERKWHQKIIGFRSGKRWKQVTAIIGYLIFFSLIMSMFGNAEETDVANDNEPVETASAEQDDEDSESETNNDNEEENKEDEVEKEKEEEEKFLVDFNEKIEIDNDNVLISVDTNLLDGTIIHYEIENVNSIDHFIDGELEVVDGKAETIVDISDFPNGEIHVFAGFMPYMQSDDLFESYGDMGQLLEGDKVEYVESVEANTIEFTKEYIKSVPIELTGTGDTATETFELTDGFAVVELTHNGASNFIVEVKNEQGGSELLVNEIGSYSGSSLFIVPAAGKYLLDIDANGQWTANISQTIPEDPHTEPLSVEGQGSDVVFFESASGMKRFEFTHNGSSNFIVEMNGQGLLVNEIGQYSGSTTYTLQDNGLYVLSIQADGSWTIEME